MILSRNKVLVFFFLLLSALLRADKCGADSFSREYMIKAGFMANFLRFSTWPEDNRPGPGEAFRIGICGNAPAARIITRALAPPRKIAGHPITVKTAPASDLLDCHLVFFAGPIKNGRGVLLPFFQKRHVLTVGESDNFLSIGGIINLSVVNQKIVFDINHTAALKSKIHLSAKILQVARTVIIDKKARQTLEKRRKK